MTDHIQTIRTALKLSQRHLLWAGFTEITEIDRALASLSALQEERERMQAVIEAARCIRHWHDTANGGMIVSQEKVFALWDALKVYDAAMEPAPQEGRS